MPAKATLGKENGKELPEMSRAERVSLKKFSVSVVLLQAFPLFLLAVFTVIAGSRYGRLDLKIGLTGILFLLVVFYFAMPRLTQKVFGSIVALRGLKLSKKARMAG